MVYVRQLGQCRAVLGMRTLKDGAGQYELRKTVQDSAGYVRRCRTVRVM
jgi:hypothetical protein